MVAPKTDVMEQAVREKVLCVEDNTDECELVKEILKDYEVICVPTVDEACHLLETLDPALMIIDEHLPDGSGLGFCREVSKRNKNMPVIIISGDLYITAAEAVEAGAKAFLAKSRPTYVDELHQLTRRHAKSATA
jgi:DNA-binding NtrC family response regulator